MDQDMTAALQRVAKAAHGDSNDEEIEALREALELALTRWPDAQGVLDDASEAASKEAWSQ